MIRFAYSVTLALCLCAVLPRGAAASDEDELRAGVLVVSTLGVDDDAAQTIAEHLRQALGEMLLVDIASAGETMKGLGQPITEDCVSDVECVRQASSKLGVSEILFLAIVRIGDRVQINVTWADGATGATEPRDPIRIDDPKRERILLAQSATRLLPNARRRPDAPDPLVITVVSSRRRHLTRGSKVAGGIGLLALAGGTTFGILAIRVANGPLDACKPNCDLTEEGRKDLDRLRLRRNLADACFAAAAVAGVTAAILYWRSGGEESKPVIDVALAPSAVNLSFTARF